MFLSYYAGYTIFRGNNITFLYILGLSTLLLFALTQSYIKPYKSDVINLLDLSVMVNLQLIVSTTWYFIFTNRGWMASTITAPLVLIVMIMFGIVLIYHILWVPGKLPKLQVYLYNVSLDMFSCQEDTKNLLNTKITSALTFMGHVVFENLYLVLEKAKSSKL